MAGVHIHWSAGAVGMVDHQQRDAFDFGGRGEADDRFAVAVRAEARRTASDFPSTLLFAPMTSSTPS